MSEREKRTSTTQTAREAAYGLRVAMGAFKRRVQETHGQGDLTSPQLIALARLDRLGEMTTADLARREQISPQAMGSTIASLEKLGLVERSTDVEDGRRAILSLTPEGLAAIHSGRNTVVDRITVVLEESFAEEETGILAAAAPLIQRLADLL